jgi:Rrf2 family protein
MIDIALNSNGSNVSLKDISARQNISVKYLEQIIGLRCKIGFLRSTRGSQGGYKLAKEPHEYTVGSILRVTEGNLAPVTCLEDEQNKCSLCFECATLDFWEGLYDVINEYVDKFTLQDLLDEHQRRNGADYFI